MTPPRKSSRPVRVHSPPPPPPEPPWWKTKANTIVLAAAGITAALYLFGALKPIFDSGPLPVPARTEVTTLQKDLEGHVDVLNKALSETLQAAQTANSTAQQALTQTSEFRLDRLLTTKAQLEDQIRRNPNDVSLRTALAHTELDIQNIPMGKK